jgi:hypothetical protein
MAAFDLFLLEARARFRAGLHFPNYQLPERRGKSCDKSFSPCPAALTRSGFASLPNPVNQYRMLPDHFSAYPQPLMKILLAFGVGLAIAALL